jgi:hypothetical protein
LLHLYNRLGKGQKWTQTAVYTARHLREAARYVHAAEPLALTDSDLEKIESFRKLVTVPDTHLLLKTTRVRLAALKDPDTEERFLKVPAATFEEADVLLAEGQRSKVAHLHQAALALAIHIHKLTTPLIFTPPRKYRRTRGVL